ncbi:Z1 domain-containing protein [Planococcus donghaensis]|uniref:Z1 domain-containing protein n=1 Tax=Planococcus donghaensis TaxID=414778 RepID=UPI003734EFE8
MVIEMQVQINKSGSFYEYLSAKNKYDKATKLCIENTAEKLKTESTTSNKPGILLGKIQSGKTRTFIGVMGLSYDNLVDVVIILTKNSNALAKQTYERLTNEFGEQVLNDKMQVFDIMSLPTNLRKFELSQKLAIIVKKETKNMDRLNKALFELYPFLAEKRILFIDDEADFASVAFERKKESDITEMKVISGKIDRLREKLNKASFLQVTATPYSLYLQPEDMQIHEHKLFQPIRPSFTELVPIHDKYVGGELYFEKSEEEGHLASHLHHEVAEKELVILKKPDLRRIKMDKLLTSTAVKDIRSSIVNFLVGSCIRRWQQEKLGQKVQKYAFIIHTERGKSSHEWQEQIISEIELNLRQVAESQDENFHFLIKESYDDLMKSVSLLDIPQPSFVEIVDEVRKSLINEYLLSSIVNSEKDVNQLLDETGQLRLRTPMNIFIGGQILDRGVTINNLIGFYYGRNPKSFQQDTVLQHSRMYGARSIEDLSVTRFYTTKRLYEVMKKIHEFDSELRRAVESGGHGQGVVFIQKDNVNKIIPCSPNKILLSNITMLKPFKRILPVGFQTGSKSQIQNLIKQIDQIVHNEKKAQNGEDVFKIPVNIAKQMLTLIFETLKMEDGYEWDLEEYLSVLDYLSFETDSLNHGYVWLITKEGRNIKRKDKEGRFENSPDTPKGEKGELRLARSVAKDIPALILLKQNGLKDNDWNDTPFWWPIIVAPSETIPTVFAKKTIKQ